MKIREIIEEQQLVEYIQHIEGHENSKEEDAPWVIKDHDSHKILASFSTKKEAREHLKRMKTYG